LPVLKRWHEPLDSWLAGLPLWTARICAIALFTIAAVWVLSLKREFVFRGAPDSAAWRDLRLWGVLVLVPYVLIYALL